MSFVPDVCLQLGRLMRGILTPRLLIRGLHLCTFLPQRLSVLRAKYVAGHKAFLTAKVNWQFEKLYDRQRYRNVGSFENAKYISQKQGPAYTILELI